MAPQLGMGTFRIVDHLGNVVGYATSDYNLAGDPNCANGSTEIWAMRKPNTGGTPFPWPVGSGAAVTLTFWPVLNTYLVLAAFCAFLKAPPQNEDPAHFCIRTHAITATPCPPPAQQQSKG